MDQEFPEIMTIMELEKYLKVGRHVILLYCKQGMPYFTLTDHPASHKRFKKSDVDEWISNRGKQGCQAVG